MHLLFYILGFIVILGIVGIVLWKAGVFGKKSGAGRWMANIPDDNTCSVKCGGGTKVKTYKCMKQDETTGEYVEVTDSECVGEKPAPEVMPCNTDPCPMWNIGEWDRICPVCLESGEVVTKTRNVTCTSSTGAILPDSECTSSLTDPKPDTTETCANLPTCAPLVSVDSTCITDSGKPCGTGKFIRTWTCPSGATCKQTNYTESIVCGESNPPCGNYTQISSTPCTKSCGTSGTKSETWKCEPDGAWCEQGSGETKTISGCPAVPCLTKWDVGGVYPFVPPITNSATITFNPSNPTIIVGSKFSNIMAKSLTIEKASDGTQFYRLSMTGMNSSFQNVVFHSDFGLYKKDGVVVPYVLFAGDFSTGYNPEIMGIIGTLDTSGTKIKSLTIPWYYNNAGAKTSVTITATF